MNIITLHKGVRATNNGSIGQKLASLTHEIKSQGAKGPRGQGAKGPRGQGAKGPRGQGAKGPRRNS